MGTPKRAADQPRTSPHRLPPHWPVSRSALRAGAGTERGDSRGKGPAVIPQTGPEGQGGQAWGGGGDRTSLRVTRPRHPAGQPRLPPDALDKVVGVSATDDQAG